jgi:hypothetical protein
MGIQANTRRSKGNTKKHPTISGRIEKGTRSMQKYEKKRNFDKIPKANEKVSQKSHSSDSGGDDR